MIHEEILAAVQTDPALVALVPDTQAIADALSAGRTKTVERMAELGTPMKYLGAEAGAALLDQMETLAATSPTVKWGFKLLERGQLDLGLDSTRAMLDTLLPAEAAAVLKSLAEVADPVSEFDVRCALLNNDGTWRV